VIICNFSFISPKSKLKSTASYSLIPNRADPLEFRRQIHHAKSLDILLLFRENCVILALSQYTRVPDRRHIMTIAELSGFECGAVHNDRLSEVYTFMKRSDKFLKKKSTHLTIAERCTTTNWSMVTTIHSLFHYCATADRHMYDGGGVSSYDSHFANIGDRHEIGTLINITWWNYS